MNRAASIAAGLALLLLGAASAQATRGSPPALDGGLLVSRTADAWSPDVERFRAAGPVVERIHAPSGRTFCAFRPIAASLRDPAIHESVTHVLWPLFTSRRRGDERSWNSALIAYGRDADIRDPASQWSLLVLPILACGRTEQGKGYAGVFPLAGRLQEVAGRDEIDFVLFPLYSYTRQRDLNTWNVLFPIISWTRSPDKGGFRVFPLYGQSHEPGVSRRFVFWPVWTSTTTHAPKAPGYAWMLFPVAGRVNMTNQQSWMALPPLFRYTRTKDSRQWMAPWPFIQVERGGPDTRTYVWPLYGQRERPDISTRFVLWPIGRAETVREPKTTVSRRWVVPFYYDERRFARPEAAGGALERRVRIWPLATYQRSGDRMEFHTLELWPAAPVPAVERLYAPFWTLYTHERSGKDVSDELLWGLFRRQRGDGYAYTSVFPLVSWGGSGDNRAKRWDVLKGFVGYEREDGVRQYRILYMRFK